MLIEAEYSAISAGTEVANLKERERTVFRKGNIGFVFQSFNLIDELNVYENVELPLIYLKMKSGERKKKVEDAEKSMNMNALEFGLKMNKKELDNIPVNIRDKVKSVLLENQYLRGIIDGNNRQIQAMKKQVELCIMQIGARK